MNTYILNILKMFNLKLLSIMLIFVFFNQTVSALEINEPTLSCDSVQNSEYPFLDSNTISLVIKLGKKIQNKYKTQNTSFKIKKYKTIIDILDGFEEKKDLSDKNQSIVLLLKQQFTCEVQSIHNEGILSGQINTPSDHTFYKFISNEKSIKENILITKGYTNGGLVDLGINTTLLGTQCENKGNIKYQLLNNSSKFITNPEGNGKILVNDYLLFECSEYNGLICSAEVKGKKTFLAEGGKIIVNESSKFIGGTQNINKEYLCKKNGTYDIENKNIGDPFCFAPDYTKKNGSCIKTPKDPTGTVFLGKQCIANGNFIVKGKKIKTLIGFNQGKRESKYGFGSWNKYDQSTFRSNFGNNGESIDKGYIINTEEITIFKENGNGSIKSKYKYSCNNDGQFDYKSIGGTEVSCNIGFYKKGFQCIPKAPYCSSPDIVIGNLSFASCDLPYYTSYNKAQSCGGYSEFYDYKLPTSNQLYKNFNKLGLSNSGYKIDGQIKTDRGLYWVSNSVSTRFEMKKGIPRVYSWNEYDGIKQFRTRCVKTLK